MVVRMRHTKAHTANRRSHHKLETPGYVLDQKTGSNHLRHRVDLKTGIYRGKKVLDLVKAKSSSKKKSK